MRLRLSVQRHRLPPSNILWSLPSQHSTQAYTIARLLDDINAIIPLEAEHWGLEDYVVEVGGYECLHFSPVSQALKDDDEVWYICFTFLLCDILLIYPYRSIRPLLTAETRARTLTGRCQISDGGQHLVDGIPFGRPYLRAPNRPVVRIPPRKRQRLDDDDTVAGDDENAPVGLLENANVSSHEPAPLLLAEKPTHHATSKTKTVSFHEPATENDSDEDDEEEFVPEDVESEMSVDDNSASDDSYGSSESSDDSFEASDSDDSSSEASSDSSSDDSDDGTPELLSAKNPVTPPVPPGSGKEETKTRNARRKEQVRLRRLKEQGILGPDAALADLRSLTTGQQSLPDAVTGLQSPEKVDPNNITKTNDSQKVAEESRKRKRKTDQTEPEAEQSDRIGELEKRKQQLLASLNNNTPASPVEADTSEAVEQSAETKSSNTKRPKVDKAAFGRILKHQTTPLNKRPAKPPLKPNVEPEAPLDSDLWKSRINLSAFECWEEEYTLSAPPYPFKQHWDPASKQMREKAMEQQQSRKKKSNRKSSQNVQRNIEQSPEPIVLDYGDELADAGEKQVGTLDPVESQLLQDVEAATALDLPVLPDDIESLPALTQSDIRIGAVVVFKLFTINPLNMSPEISCFKTAVVQDEGDSGNGAGLICLRLADRDRSRRPKKYDSVGNRVYDRVDNFRMGDSDDEDEDERDGVVYRHFGELLDSKLLRPATPSA